MTRFGVYNDFFGRFNFGCNVLDETALGGVYHYNVGKRFIVTFNLCFGNTFPCKILDLTKYFLPLLGS